MEHLLFLAVGEHLIVLGFPTANWTERLLFTAVGKRLLFLASSPQSIGRRDWEYLLFSPQGAFQRPVCLSDGLLFIKRPVLSMLQLSGLVNPENNSDRICSPKEKLFSLPSLLSPALSSSFSLFLSRLSMSFLMPLRGPTFLQLLIRDRIGPTCLLSRKVPLCPCKYFYQLTPSFQNTRFPLPYLRVNSPQVFKHDPPPL